MKTKTSFYVIKCVFTLGLVIAVNVSSFAQSMAGYIRDRGVNLAEMIHTSNDFIRGSYANNSGYTDITVYTQDHFFDRVITTKLRLVHGFGSLYFKDIIVLADNDITKPFDAFGVQAALLARVVKEVDRASYDKIRYDLKKSFGQDFENWTGKQWAILALNLDYLSYLGQ